jgi:hypothetical protein
LEVQREHRTARGFLSKTHEEHEAEIAGSRIIALQEDNEGLRNERDELEGSHKKLKEQLEKLRGEKTVWQGKYLDLLGRKRPREEQPDSSGKKHRPGELIQASSSASPAPPPSSSSSVTDIATTGPKPHIEPHHIARTSSSSTNRNNKNRGSNKEPSNEVKEALRKELGLSYSPWDSSLDKDQQVDVTLALWKRGLQKRARYVPDYSTDKMQYYGIEHKRNKRFSMSAFDQFRKLTRNLEYAAWVEDKHNEFDRHQNRNHIPRTIGTYLDIINDPASAAFVRCIPVDLYYYQVASDSEGSKYQVQLRNDQSCKGKDIALSQAHTSTLNSRTTSHTMSSAHEEAPDSQAIHNALYT